MNLHDITKKYYKKIIIAIGLIVFAFFSYACIFARPFGDDYLNSVELYKIVKAGSFSIFDLLKEAVKHDIEICQTFQTTYVSNFFFALQAGIFGSEYYSLSVFFIVLMSFFCICYFQKAFLSFYKINTSVTASSLVLFMILFCGMPSIVCGLYWYVGAFHYVVFYFLFILNVGLLLNYCHFENKRYIIASTILSFIISGGNQVTALLNTLAILLLFILMMKKKPFIFASFLSGFIGCCINAFSSGSQNRFALFSHSTSIFETVYECVIYSRDIIFEWMDSRLVFAIIIALLFSLRYANINTKNETRLNPLVVLVGLYLLFMSTLFVPHFALGAWGPRRVVNVQWFTFICTSMYFVFYFVTWIKNKGLLVFEYHGPNCVYELLQIVCVLCVVGMVGSNTLKIIYELKTGILSDYRDAYENRINYILESKDEIVYVDVLPESEVLFYGDISSEWEDNEYIFEIYGKKVALKINDNQ